MNKIEELTNAHDQGFLSDADFESKLVLLTANTSTVLTNVGNFVERAANSETAND